MQNYETETLKLEKQLLEKRYHCVSHTGFPMFLKERRKDILSRETFLDMYTRHCLFSLQHSSGEKNPKEHSNPVAQFLDPHGFVQS